MSTYDGITWDGNNLSATKLRQYNNFPPSADATRLETGYHISQYHNPQSKPLPSMSSADRTQRHLSQSGPPQSQPGLLKRDLIQNGVHSEPQQVQSRDMEIGGFLSSTDRHYSPPSLGRPSGATHPVTERQRAARADELAQMRAHNRKSFKSHRNTLQSRASARGQGAGNMKGEYLWWIKDQFKALLQSGRVHHSEEELFIRVKQEERRIELITSRRPPRHERSKEEQTSRPQQRNRSIPSPSRPTQSSHSGSRESSYNDSRDSRVPAASISTRDRSHTPSIQRTPLGSSYPVPLFSYSSAGTSPAPQASLPTTPHATNSVRQSGGLTSGVAVKQERRSFGIPQPGITDQEIQSLIESTIESQATSPTSPGHPSKKRTASEEINSTLFERPAKRIATETDLSVLIPGYEDMLTERTRKEDEMAQLQLAKDERLKKRAQKAEEKARLESIAAFEREIAQADRKHSKALPLREVQGDLS